MEKDEEKNGQMAMLAERLKAVRVVRNMTELWLSYKTGIDIKTIKKYERRGVSTRCDLTALVKIAEVLGVSTEYLLGVTDEHGLF